VREEGGIGTTAVAWRLYLMQPEIFCWRMMPAGTQGLLDLSGMDVLGKQVYINGRLIGS
jgi:hypothetical protein